jgi:hypothetical protein
MQNRIGPSRIHLPIPIERENEFLLGALIHWFHSVNLARPHSILKISEGDAELIRCKEQFPELDNWIGPVFNQTTENIEQRLLDISIHVFDRYLINSRDELVEDYAKNFYLITPLEFLPFYKEINERFLKWLNPG